MQFLTKEDFFPKFYKNIYIDKNYRWNKDNIFYTLLSKNLYNENFSIKSFRHSICDKTDKYLLDIKNDIETFGHINVLDRLIQDSNKSKNSDVKL